jgi:RNA polymerase sigma factor (sigma-70 family)
MNCVIIERPFNTRKEDVTMRLPTQTVIQMYQDNLFRIAFSICQNREDAEDVVQETFLRYHSGAVDFNDEMHIRAWLIRVTINQSKNMLRTFGNEFVKMIFVSFLNSNIYLLKKRLTSRVGIFLETPYSKASSHFPIASH